MNIKSLNNKRAAVHCPTKELSEKFLSECEAAGFVIDGHDRTFWYVYREDTCYALHGDISYCDIRFYENEGFDIIEYNDTEESKMNKFKIGDRVIAKKITPYSVTTNGWVGKVTEIQRSGLIRVSDGSCGYVVNPKYFDPLHEEKIVVMTDGKTTTAKLYNGKTVTKTAKAKCSPDDEFNFLTGAHLAVSRLCGVESITQNDEPEEKIKPGDFVKVVKTECHHFPLGSIVQVKGIMFDSFKCYGLLKNPYNDNKYEFSEQLLFRDDIVPV